MADRPKRWQQLIERVTRPLSRSATVVSAVTLIALTLLIATEALLRSFADYSIDFVHELSGYGVALLTLVGGAVSLRERGFFRVSFFFERLPYAVRRVLLWIHVLLALVFCVALLRYTAQLALGSYQGGNQSSTTLATPLYIPQIVLPIGGILLIVFLVEIALRPGRSLDEKQDGAEHE